LYILLFAINIVAVAQRSGSQSIEIGALGQTASNKITAPFRVVEGPSSLAILGTHHAQVFGGPLVDYTYGFDHFLSIEGRVAYLLGSQPTVNLTGGHAILAGVGIKAEKQFGRYRLYGRITPGLVSFSKAGEFFDVSGTRDVSRLTHFALDEGVGAEYRFTTKDVLRLDVSQVFFGERKQSLPSQNAITVFLPSEVENHLTFSFGGCALLSRFGQQHAGNI
jgi:hypothetical protein